MYRRVLPLLLAAALRLSGCTAGQMDMPQKTQGSTTFFMKDEGFSTKK